MQELEFCVCLYFQHLYANPKMIINPLTYKLYNFWLQ
jgi:hypothetical protein